MRVGLSAKTIGEKVAAINKMFWLITGSLAATGIRWGVDKLMKFILGDEDDEDISLLKRLFWEITGTIPFIGQALSVMMYRSEPIPVLEMPRALLVGGYKAFTGKTGETRLRGLLEFGEATGEVLGIPGALQLRELFQEKIKSPEERKKWEIESKTTEKGRKKWKLK
jgi:hypothetical protein